jgi:alkanesulfonate monooxygenase SsuD/methylene tetrahydromethanopterin reductase-like flavin-dependent oxidoreductase (luciferase family)
VWVLGSSAGESATIAGELGLRFAASYHVSPGTALEAVDYYRQAFRPSSDLSQPHVCVSADVVVADDDATARQRDSATARRLAAGYGLWVRSIRCGEGAIPFPSPEEAAAHVWTEEDRALVADRTETQFVGSPQTVIEQLSALPAATGADELAITTITHEHADRVRLLADAWGRS